MADGPIGYDEMLDELARAGHNMKLARKAAPRTKQQLSKSDALLKGIAGALVQHVREATAPLAKRISALEQQAANAKYVGVWKEGTTYKQGNFVSDHGSVWHCDTDTTRRPGQSDDFTLAVKRGADAEPRRANAPTTIRSNR